MCVDRWLLYHSSLTPYQLPIIGYGMEWTIPYLLASEFHQYWLITGWIEKIESGWGVTRVTFRLLQYRAPAIRVVAVNLLYSDWLDWCCYHYIPEFGLAISCLIICDLLDLFPNHIITSSCWMKIGTPHACVEQLIVSDRVSFRNPYHTRVKLECNTRPHKQRDLM